MLGFCINSHFKNLSRKFPNWNSIVLQTKSARMAGTEEKVLLLLGNLLSEEHQNLKQAPAADHRSRHLWILEVGRPFHVYYLLLRIGFGEQHLHYCRRKNSEQTGWDHYKVCLHWKVSQNFIVCSSKIDYFNVSVRICS